MLYVLIQLAHLTNLKLTNYLYFLGTFHHQINKKEQLYNHTVPKDKLSVPVAPKHRKLAVNIVCLVSTDTPI